MNRTEKILLICMTAICAGSVFLHEIFSAKNDIIILETDTSDSESLSIVSETQTSTSSAKTSKTKSTKTTSSTSRTTATETPTTSTFTASATAIKTEPTEEFLYIDINSAEKDELIKLHGIGDYLSDSIIKYREEHGGFRNIEEIMLVSGIGEAIFDGIKENIYVENPVYDAENEQNEDFSESTENEITEFYEEATTEPPTAEETTIEPPTAEKTSLTLEDVVPININTAEIEVLMLLPYIDEEKANAIIELRKNINGFSNTYELLLAEGMKQNELAEIIGYLTVE